MNKVEFSDVLNKMKEIHDKKNSDYGNSFHDSFVEFGPISGVVRMCDKMNRIKSLINKENLVKDESIEDTLIDLANYSIMLYLELINK